jgi:hypothetical protein
MEVFFKIVFPMSRRGHRRACGFCFSKSFDPRYAMHRRDEDFADLANLGFAKICEYLGLSFLKMTGNVA